MNVQYTVSLGAAVCHIIAQIKYFDVILIAHSANFLECALAPLVANHLLPYEPVRLLHKLPRQRVRNNVASRIGSSVSWC
jgi:hypothetical protein